MSAPRQINSRLPPAPQIVTPRVSSGMAGLNDEQVAVLMTALEGFGEGKTRQASMAFLKDRAKQSRANPGFATSLELLAARVGQAHKRLQALGAGRVTQAGHLRTGIAQLAAGGDAFYEAPTATRQRAREQQRPTPSSSTAKHRRGTG